jgi:hypothetical protein
LPRCHFLNTHGGNELFEEQKEFRERTITFDDRKMPCNGNKIIQFGYIKGIFAWMSCVAGGHKRCWMVLQYFPFYGSCDVNRNNIVCLLQYNMVIMSVHA